MLLLVSLASLAHATTVGGYFRLQARPDLVGGDGALGTSSLYGRLLNEGPWGLLELRQPLVGTPDTPAGSLTLRIEGGATPGGDATNGSLLGFRVTQLHVDVDRLACASWRVGTLETTFGDLWLFDARPTQLMVDVLGGSVTFSPEDTALTLGLGDAGWTIGGARYHAVPSAGAALTRHLGPWTLGLSGQAWYEPANADPDGLVDTDGLDRDGWADPSAWVTAHPTAALTPGKAVSGRGWKLATHLGFTSTGVVRDARLQGTWQRQLPDPPVTVTVGDEEVRVGAAKSTDQRDVIVAAAQVDLAPVPDRLEVAWGAYVDARIDPDDTADESTGNRVALATVARAQLGVARHVALLAEGSVAHEAARGLPAKDTWQGKGGVILSPAGTGLGARPALRFLGGVQHSSLPDAWPGTPTGSRWHAIGSIEAEAWF